VPSRCRRSSDRTLSGQCRRRRPRRHPHARISACVRTGIGSRSPAASDPGIARSSSRQGGLRRSWRCCGAAAQDTGRPMQSSQLPCNFYTGFRDLHREENSHLPEKILAYLPYVRVAGGSDTKPLRRINENVRTAVLISMVAWRLAAARARAAAPLPLREPGKLPEGGPRPRIGGRRRDMGEESWSGAQPGGDLEVASDSRPRRQGRPGGGSMYSPPTSRTENLPTVGSDFRTRRHGRQLLRQRPARDRRRPTGAPHLLRAEQQANALSSARASKRC